MPKSIAQSLCPEKALIFRIVHRDNLPFILKNGLHCSSSDVLDPNFVSIGSDDIIDKRGCRQVPLAPGGTLRDYVPFYFTPYSPMMLNIKSGWGGIRKRDNDEIVVLVSSLHQLAKQDIPFLFTNQHALLKRAYYFDAIDSLDEVDFELLQRRDFKRDPDDPGKTDRYMAEALVHQHCPTSALLGVVCYNQTVLDEVNLQMQARQLGLKTYARPSWYF